MKTLLEFYDLTKRFAESHSMINEFGVLGNEDELQGLDFEYRSMQLIVNRSNMSRQLNAPTYSMEFSLVVLDKTFDDDDRAELQSTEENLFVIGQYQDYLLQQDATVEFDEVDFVTAEGDDYNVVAAYANFTVTFDRTNHMGGIASLDDAVAQQATTELLINSIKESATAARFFSGVGAIPTDVALEFTDAENLSIYYASSLPNVQFDYEVVFAFIGRTPAGVGDPFPNNEAVVYSGTATTSSISGGYVELDGMTMRDYWLNNPYAFLPYPTIIGLRINGVQNNQVGVALLNHTDGIYTYL